MSSGIRILSGAVSAQLDWCLHTLITSTMHETRLSRACQYLLAAQRLLVTRPAVDSKARGATARAVVPVARIRRCHTSRSGHLCRRRCWTRRRRAAPASAPLQGWSLVGQKLRGRRRVVRAPSNRDTHLTLRRESSVRSSCIMEDCRMASQPNNRPTDRKKDSLSLASRPVSHCHRRRLRAQDIVRSHGLTDSSSSPYLSLPRGIPTPPAIGDKHGYRLRSIRKERVQCIGGRRASGVFIYSTHCVIRSHEIEYRQSPANGKHS
ncbi:hypothetical protein DAEQUDRAFT_753897, partial [Daedalea quercina L-15889]